MSSVKTLINNIIQKAVYRYRYSSDSYVDYLRGIGAKIGDRVNFFNPQSTIVDIQNPHLLTIGDDVQITANVNILTHDFSWSVLKKKYGEVIGGVGPVHIGNNVFIGMNTTVLKNTFIGDNVIIGANSLVSGTFPSDCVIAGNPAKVIMTIDEYYEKRKKAAVDEAKAIYKGYVNRYNKEPDVDIFNEYFWLFTNSENELTEACRNQMKNCGNEKESYDLFKNHKPQFDSFSAMIDKFRSEAE